MFVSREFRRHVLYAHVYCLHQFKDAEEGVVRGDLLHAELARQERHDRVPPGVERRRRTVWHRLGVLVCRQAPTIPSLSFSLPPSVPPSVPPSLFAHTSLAPSLPTSFRPFVSPSLSLRPSVRPSVPPSLPIALALALSLSFSLFPLISITLSFPRFLNFPFSLSLALST